MLKEKLKLTIVSEENKLLHIFNNASQYMDMDVRTDAQVIKRAH